MVLRRREESNHLRKLEGGRVGSIVKEGTRGGPILSKLEGKEASRIE